MDEVVDYAVSNDISSLSKLFPHYKWLTFKQACAIVSERSCIMRRLSEEYVAAFDLPFYTIRLFFFAPVEVLA
jgi:hypothetical protein